MASGIPNLLTSRENARSVGRGRGRGRGGLNPVTDEDPRIVNARKDGIVQQTDQDASISRMSAVDVGYLDDQFAKFFAVPGQLRRFPIINRGTYLRTTAIDDLVNDFLSAIPPSRKQIISLGAGSDTRYFRLMSKANPPNLLYHELDFPVNTQQKITKIHLHTNLSQHIGPESTILTTDSELHSPNYHIHAIDLRDLNPFHASQAGPGRLHHIDPSLPTLLISECCLIYLTPEKADAVVNYFTAQVFHPSTPLGLILYEPTNPFDAFGKVMVANLAARGIVMQTLQKYSSLAIQKERLRAYGFGDGAGAVDVDFLHEEWIAEEEKARVAKVEMLDEVEELNLLAKHYCVVWGWRNGEGSGNGNGGGGRVWEGWKRRVSQ